MQKLVNTLVKFIHPVPMVISILTFSLGTGIADFLGNPIDWIAHWVGMICILLLLTSSQLLDAFFSQRNNSAIFKKEQHSNIEQLPAEQLLRILLQMALTTLTAGAALTVLLLANGVLGITAIIFLGLSFFLAFLYSVPPLHFSQNGYGELVESILIVNLVPAFAFLLQVGELHRLLVMLTMPLTGLVLAMKFANALPNYGNDIKSGRRNLMTTIGWERGVQFHNLLILFSYGIIAFAFIFGLPWRLVWPSILTLPLGLYQIWQLRQIALGLKPNWKILRLTSIGLIGLTAYLMMISLWIG